MIPRFAGAALLLLICSCASAPGRIRAQGSFVRERFRFTCDPVDFNPLYLRQAGEERVLYWGDRPIPLANCKEPCTFVGTHKPGGLAVWFHDLNERRVLHSTEGWGAGPFSSHGLQFWSGEAGVATCVPEVGKPEQWRLALNGTVCSEAFGQIWRVAIGRSGLAFQTSTPDHEHFIQWGAQRFGPFDFVDSLWFDDQDRLLFLADEKVYRDGVEVIAEEVDKVFFAGDRLLTLRDRVLLQDGREVLTLQGSESLRHASVNAAGVLALIVHRDRTFEVRGSAGALAFFDDVHWCSDPPSSVPIYVGAKGGLDYIWTGNALQGPFDLVGMPAINLRGTDAGIPVLKDGAIDVLRVRIR